MDPMGCMTADTCVPQGEECPFYCPSMLPMDCGEGSMNCPGWVDSMGCKAGDTCVPYGEECPRHCPFNPPADCGDGMFPCPGPMDYMGCASAETCAVNAPVTVPSPPLLTVATECSPALD